MKTILLTAITLFTAFAMAQMPDAEALKKNANSAIDTTAKQTEKTELDTKQALVTGKAKAVELKDKALINLNTASAADLGKLPGIGPARAQRIIEGRPYKEVSDLKKIKGINEGIIAKLKDHVTTK